MKDFAAIDFETANYNRASICSVGVVIVRNGEIAERLYHLVRPYPNFYCRVNTDIHGLTRSDTDGARPFPEVWQMIAPAIAGLTLVAHNSQFDESCLRAAFAAYEMEYPANYHFLCTCRASRRYFGRTLTDHRLPTVARACGYDLASHHHALADAEASAYIAREIL